jgi:hypothetical protein
MALGAPFLLVIPPCSSILAELRFEPADDVLEAKER